MTISKVVYGNRVLIDLTADTVAAETLLKGVTAHGADGETIIGSCEFDANTQDATAAAEEILAGKTAYNKGQRITGTMKNNGAVSGEIAAKTGVYTVSQGYHNGSGKVQISVSEQEKLVPGNIREGITILGVAGEMSGTEGITHQAKSVTPAKAQQVVLPDEGYNYLSQVTVVAIPYSESGNAAGGTTVTIA